VNHAAASMQVPTKLIVDRIGFDFPFQGDQPSALIVSGINEGVDADDCLDEF